MDCKIIAALVLCAGAAHADLLPRDINGDGIVDAFYDSAQDLTFTADANLPAAFGLGDGLGPHPPPNGLLEHAHAVAWADSLDLYGVTGWRLPLPLSFACRANPDSPPDSPPDPLPFSCVVDKSEFSLLPTFSAFSNVQGEYWLGGLLPFTELMQGRFLLFSPSTGAYSSTNQGSVPASAWAVHDGDIAALATPVPEPETWALMLLGLMAMRLSTGCRALRPR